MLASGHENAAATGSNRSVQSPSANLAQGMLNDRSKSINQRIARLNNQSLTRPFITLKACMTRPDKGLGQIE